MFVNVKFIFVNLYIMSMFELHILASHFYLHFFYNMHYV